MRRIGEASVREGVGLEEIAELVVNRRLEYVDEQPRGCGADEGDQAWKRDGEDGPVRDAVQPSREPARHLLQDSHRHSGGGACRRQDGANLKLLQRVEPGLEDRGAKVRHLDSR
ncbi:MAG: hypothetical protein FD180_2048 [Planctomycetota bacterium]|nr:MAG: hypothetical protein FD180_2048 [Planctomycetota bacterium]